MKQISVDISMRCPCCCRYCAPHIDTPAGDMMTNDAFAKIVTILVAEKYNFVYLYSFGEPYTNPNIYDHVDCLRLHHITTDIASKLSVHFDWPRMSKSYPDRMLITIDSLKHDVMKRIAPGINPKLVFENLEALAELYAEHPEIHLVFNTTVCSLNYTELDSIRTFLEARFKLHNHPVHYSGKAMGLGFGCVTPTARAHAVKAAADLWTDKFSECRFKIEKGLIIPLYDKRCWPVGKVCEPIPVINPKGMLTPCCHDAFSSCILGDVVKEKTIDGLLLREPGKSIMKKARILGLPICTFCN